MFDDADIMLHYEQGTMVRSRKRRYLSNPLRKVLNHIDWNATFTKNIPFNFADQGVRILGLLCDSGVLIYLSVRHHLRLHWCATNGATRLLLSSYDAYIYIYI